LPEVKNVTTNTCVTPDHSLIISEIGFNDQGSNAYQYIELYNTTTEPLSLSNITIQGKNLTLPLSGTIAPQTYAVVTDDYDIPNISVLQRTPWEGKYINNKGDTVTLSSPTGTLDTVTIPDTAYPYRGAFERSLKDFRFAPGTYTNYIHGHAFALFVGNTNIYLYGTAGTRNTIDYVLTELNGTYTTQFSPYLILRPGLTLQPGDTATFEPGTTIQTGAPYGNNAPRITVHGTLNLQGTAALPVTIEGAGGHFDSIEVLTGGTLTGDYAHLKTGGSWNPFSPTPGMIQNNGGTVTFTNSSFTDTAQQTFFVSGGTTTLTNIIITNPSWTYESNIKTGYGIYQRAGTFRGENIFVNDVVGTALFTTPGADCVVANLTTGDRTGGRGGCEVAVGI
jgi:hypothetical protein